MSEAESTLKTSQVFKPPRITCRLKSAYQEKDPYLSLSTEWTTESVCKGWPTIAQFICSPTVHHAEFLFFSWVYMVTQNKDYTFQSTLLLDMATKLWPLEWKEKWYMQLSGYNHNGRGGIPFPFSLLLTRTQLHSWRSHLKLWGEPEIRDHTW